MTIIGTSTPRHVLSLDGHAQVVLAWGLDTHTGYRRRHNEDSVVAAAPIFAVADGMGGHSAGDVASKAVVTRLATAAAGAGTSSGEETASNTVTSADVIDAALKAATADISLAADSSQKGVGTTVTGVALMTKGGVAHWGVFNVGDSRVYIYEDKELTQVTVDHSVVQELVDSGLISEDEAEQHPDSNIITRAVGFNADPVTDYWLLPLRAGERLVLCSDGLSKELSSAQIREILAEGDPADRTSTRLVDAALAAGGRDNVTVLVIDVIEAPEADDD